jgi:Holliday junction resolvase RusA-like endonuclease
MIQLFVHGEPQPYPKKVGKPNGGVYFRDKTGVKQGWMAAVRRQVQAYMADKVPFPVGVPVKVTMWFYRTKPSSARKMDILPTKAPDVDNLAYGVTNQLTGVVYADDSQVVIEVISKRWAHAKQPAGVWIRIEPVPVADSPQVDKSAECLKLQL